MSFGSEPQTSSSSTNPFKGMPSWVRHYYEMQTKRAMQSDHRADALRMMFSGFNKNQHDFVHKHRTPGITDAPPPPPPRPQVQALSSLFNRGGSSDAMWSDGMTRAQMDAERASWQGASQRQSSPPSLSQIGSGLSSAVSGMASSIADRVTGR